MENKPTLKKRKNKKKDGHYNTPVAEAVQATGNFLNGVQNPLFILALILMIGGGYLIFAAGNLIAQSLDKITNKIDYLSTLLQDQKAQNADELELLNIIMNDRKRCSK